MRGEVIMRAKAAGYSAIVPTIDSTLAYPRDNNIRNDFRIPVSLGKGNAPLNEKDVVKAAQMMGVRKVDLNWDDMLWIKQETGLPVVVKGVMSPVTAREAVERGIDAVYVSNHGGPRVGRRAGLDHAIAAHRRRGEGPDPDHLRLRYSPRSGRLPRHRARRRCRRLRQTGVVRACAWRSSRRAERARISA
jgi:hypothetical protein